jgi:hypothetical protein
MTTEEEKGCLYITATVVVIVLVIILIFGT